MMRRALSLCLGAALRHQAERAKYFVGMELEDHRHMLPGALRSASASRALGVASRIGSPVSLRSMLPEFGRLPRPRIDLVFSSGSRSCPLGPEPRLPERPYRHT